MRIFAGILVLWVAVTAEALEIGIEVSFDPKGHELFGTQSLRVEEGESELWFALLANLGRSPNPYVSPLVTDSTYVAGFDPAWTKIEGVTWVGPSGERALDYELLPAPPTLQTYSLEDVVLRIEVPGEGGELRIAFRTRFPHVRSGESGRLSDIYTWRFGWHPIPIEPPLGEPPFVLPFHDYTVSLTLPEDWQAFLPGESREEGGTFVTSFSSPVNSVALYFGPKDRFRSFVLTTPGRVLEGVALPGDEEALRALLTHVPEILSWYEEHYGPYPHSHILIIEHPNEVGLAMTAEGVVYLPRWFFQRQDLTAKGTLTRYGLYILAHELAHLWWGIGVGVDFDAENWLSEGLAQYLAISWFEERFGSEDGNLFTLEQQGLGEELVKYSLGFVNLREHLTELPYLEMRFLGFDEAVVKPTREVKYDQVSADRLYNKGYLILRALAHLLGEDAFDQLLRGIAEEQRGQRLTVEEFRRALEEGSGQDLGPVFADWVTGEAWADYGITGFRSTFEGEHYVTQATLTFQGRGALPVEVAFLGPKDEELREIWLPEGEGTASLTVTTQFPVARVSVDPEHWVPDVDRLNNHWPRRFLAALRNEMPLDAYLVYTDPGSGAFALSYLDRFGFAVYPESRAAQGWVTFGREGSISGWAEITGTLTGSVTLAKNLWATPKTGSAATYWEPVGKVSLTLARLPEWAWELGLSWQTTIERAMAGEASLLSLFGGGYRMSLSHTELFGLAPNLYPTLTLSLALASPELPQEFWPELFELRSLSLAGEPIPQGERKAAGILGVWLPPFYPNYSLANAALISEARPRLFAAWGQVWSGAGSSETIPAYAEVGGEIWLTLEALGGLLQLSVVAGLAWPLLPAGPTIIYLGFAQ